jgi:glyoxylase-like metal-dependent hydrolase (beta-lactamase superfamily II)
VKIAAEVEVISTSFWGRPLNMVLFRGRELALVDTGLVGTPTEAVFPYLQGLGLAPTDLSWVIVTHAHADHFGGNEEIQKACGGRARFAGHQLDRTWIEDPPRYTRQSMAHLIDLGLMSADELATSIAASGQGVTLDSAWQGGEVLDLGDGLQLEIVFAPAHTAGNVCVLDRKHRVLVQGETICGVGQFDVNGKLLTVPYYEDLATYLRTMASVAGLRFDTFVPSHLPIMSRDQARQFFSDSLDFALRFEGEIAGRLQSQAKPVRPIELWRSLDGLWGVHAADLGLYMLLEQTLTGMLRRGQARGSLVAGLNWAGAADDGLAPLRDAARQAIDRM